MTEFQAAVALANRVLERSNADPDDELALLSRQFLRVLEKQSVPKWFPIQRSTPIRWHLAQRAYDTYARLYGTEQTLERLAERGGFGLQEFACLFNGHKPREGHAECVEKADAVGRKIAALEKAVEDLQRDLVAQHDPTGDLIQANRDQMLKMHEEAVRRATPEQRCKAALAALMVDRLPTSDAVDWTCPKCGGSGGGIGPGLECSECGGKGVKAPPMSNPKWEEPMEGF